MDTVITIGKRLIPLEHIAFVEPYDPASNPKLQSSRDYKSRIVMINRDSVLSESTPEALAAQHGFRMLEGDHIATNPAVLFSVETFEAAEGFTPSRAYATRLLWRDHDGNEQSKLLLAAPETVLAVVLRGASHTRLQTAIAATPMEAALPQDEVVRRPPRRVKPGAAIDATPQR